MMAMAQVAKSLKTTCTQVGWLDGWMVGWLDGWSMDKCANDANDASDIQCLDFGCFLAICCLILYRLLVAGVFFLSMSPSKPSEYIQPLCGLGLSKFAKLAFPGV